MSRADVLDWMRIAGYHADMRTFLRLYTENRISKRVADEAYRTGTRQKLAGMRCMCHECTKAPTSTTTGEPEK
ncbi:hypothetical protein DEH84_06930 [Aquabacterium olei]|uniref:Uncharacterized protein n=1 Tax=Aquabacterium olei TaxID=1296669 RepID=A0A2U8FQ97_9BURK|nr:hypothetical protein [Aquabacterium olei]AWI53193.1 hypothetical protein DEH84_06930 [Aquabacterium olei]